MAAFFAAAAMLIASGFVALTAATANAQTDACGTVLSGDGSVSGAWGYACSSTARQDRNAKFYTFSVSRRGSVTIDLSSSVDTYLYLREGSDQRTGAHLRFDDDGGNGRNSRITENLSAGTYTIEATTFHRYRTGQFTLAISGTGNAGSGTTASTDARFSDTCTTAVSGNGTISGTWASDCESTERSGSYSRFYTFRVSQPRLVNIELRSSETPVLYLRDGEDERAALWSGRDNIDAGATARLTSDYPFQPGVYTVEATTFYPNTTGSFTLELTGVDFVPTPAQYAACGETLTRDGAYSGSWSDSCESSERYGSYARYYTFTMERRGSAIINVDSSVDSYIYLRRGNDQRTASYTHFDDNGGVGTNARSSWVLGSGTYTLEVTTASPGIAGQFRLELSGTGNAPTTPVATNPTRAQTDNCGSTLSGDGTVTGAWSSGCRSLERTARNARFYTFTVARRAPVTIDLRSNGGGTYVDTYLYLRRGNDERSATPLLQNDNGGNRYNSRIYATLGAGTYTIEATTFAQNQTGSFELELSGTASAQQPPSDCSSTVLSGDGAFAGTWVSECRSQHRGGRYAKFYTFSVAQRTLVTINLRSSVDTYMFLRPGDDRRSGGQRGYDDDGGDGTNSRLSLNLNPGTYTIEATTFAPSRAGTFELELSGTGTVGTQPTPAPQPTPTPAPAPVPQPTPTPAPAPVRQPAPPQTDDCSSTVLSGDGAFAGTWVSECRSQHRGGRYAKFYTFSVAQRTLVTINLRSSVDTYMFLRPGDDRRSGGQRGYDDDGGDGTNSRLSLNLNPGTYTIEATTFAPSRAGTFELELSGTGTVGTQPTPAPQPAPVPAPQPAPTDNCASALSGNGSVSGTWTATCTSATREGRNARFYTFTVTQRARVTIDLSSGIDTYMYLRSGNDQRSGSYLRYDDDGGSGLNSRISETLDPGTYTIEATTFFQGPTGSFTLSLSGL